MEETILTWNITNWITVSLMAAATFFLLATVTKYIQARQSGGSSGRPVNRAYSAISRTGSRADTTKTSSGRADSGSAGANRPSAPVRSKVPAGPCDPGT